MFRNQSTAQFAAVVEAELKKGNTTIEVTDLDHEKWTTGFAQYLMDTYVITNKQKSFVADLNNKKTTKS